MSMENDVEITEGMQKYIDRNNIYLADRDRYIHQVVKKWKFDTIAVHGLYTVQDAIDDYQGSIIEPIFMSTAQAFRDSDEMAAALAYKIPAWCYSRIANPSTYYYEWTLALLEGYGFSGETSCCSTPCCETSSCHTCGCKKSHFWGFKKCHTSSCDTGCGCGCE